MTDGYEKSIGGNTCSQESVDRRLVSLQAEGAVPSQLQLEHARAGRCINSPTVLGPQSSWTLRPIQPGAPIRVIFLDVDGVLHPADVPGGCASCTVEGLFLRSCLQRLKLVVDSVDAVLVLSSSWRLDPQSLAEVTRQLATVDLTLYDTTCRESSFGALSRAEEIVEWLRARRDIIESLVVLDDLDLSLSLGPAFCVKVNGACGLTDGDVETSIRILRTTGRDLTPCEDVLAHFEEAQHHRSAWRQRWDYIASKKKKKKEKEPKRRKDKQISKGESENAYRVDTANLEAQFINETENHLDLGERHKLKTKKNENTDRMSQKNGVPEDESG